MEAVGSDRFAATREAEPQRCGIHPMMLDYRQRRPITGRQAGKQNSVMKTTSTITALLLAGSTSCALAKTDCAIDALNALHVAGVHVTQATEVASSGTTPAHCAVEGT